MTSAAAASWPDGRVEVEGTRIIAMPQGYLTRPAEQCRWEAHRKYIDIQYIVAGAEKMGWAPVASLVADGAFDEAKDVGFYTGTGDLLTVRAGMFAIFLPQDGHMPCMHPAGQAQQVRKIVMKVAIEGV